MLVNILYKTLEVIQKYLFTKTKKRENQRQAGSSQARERSQQTEPMKLQIQDDEDALGINRQRMDARRNQTDRRRDGQHLLWHTNLLHRPRQAKHNPNATQQTMVKPCHSAVTALVTLSVSKGGGGHITPIRVASSL